MNLLLWFRHVQLLWFGLSMSTSNDDDYDLLLKVYTIKTCREVQSRDNEASSN